MLKVTVYQDSDGQAQGFQISGHSGYAEAGSDIVCAAVSALAENTVNSIEAFTEDETDVLAVNEEEGFLHYRLKKVSKESALLLNALVLGLRNTEQSYGQFVQIRFEEV
ncbi:MAG: ribosomal-processing cysteine protease Prp [Lachnospiraceae bacterium]|nr:ribosomal-processing cysteine protease Prp [Lachnospiraceae bacterium]